MHVNEDGNAAYGISIPRDLYVYIPEDPDATVSDTTDKFNAAYAWGGVNLTVRTVENLTGVRIDHIIEIDFNGLIAVVDALGGVTMNVQAADADGYITDDPGIESIHGDHRFFPAGPNKLYGEEALDYVRQRYQYNEGDFARMRHQQELIKAIMDSALSAGVLTDEDKLTSFISSTSDAVKVDTEFNAITTAINLMDMRSDDLVFMTTPNLGTGEQGGQSVVIYADDPQEPESSNPEAVSLWEAVRDDKVEEWIAANPDGEEK
jgi:LCP family protein required for cell wall assembly